MPSTAESEGAIQAALEEVCASGLNSNGYPNLSLLKAAANYGVSRTTLTARWNGRLTRQEAHIPQQLLPPPQENLIKEWLKALACHSIPVSPKTLAKYATIISGKTVGPTWSDNFHTRHPDIKARWTTGLECCRAKALNCPQVTEFFAILEDVIRKFEITPSNIYNMDEKGVQLGIGKRMLALVDHDQKSVNQLESGDRELVTVIEAVCADGSFLPPSVIFKGKRRNLEWGRNNPCGASISVSENGWTDMELGFKWLVDDFEPATAARNLSNGWRLLILDRHNSHCTYEFVTFCEKHRIALICLPSHTTHRLQPCNVGVFGPLASCWKAVVNEHSRNGFQIEKSNFLSLYSEAHIRAFTDETIRSAFRKTGIWPFDPSIIEDAAFELALNTTTQAALPTAVTLPPILQVVYTDSMTFAATSDSSTPSPSPSPSPSSASPSAPQSSTSSPPTPSPDSSPSTPSPDSSPSTPSPDLSPSTPSPDLSPSTPSPNSSPSMPSPDSSPLTPSSTSAITDVSAQTQYEYVLAEFPSPMKRTARYADYVRKNKQMTEWAMKAKDQIVRDYAEKELFEHENGRIRQQLFAKKQAPRTSRAADGGPRHMTCKDTIMVLAKKDFTDQMKLVYEEASEIFKERKAKIKAYEKELKDEHDCIERERKAEERAAKKAEADAEKARLAEAKKMERVAKKVAADAKKLKLAEEKKRQKEIEREGKRQQKIIEDKEKRQRREVEKVAKKAERAAKKADTEPELFISDRSDSDDFKSINEIRELVDSIKSCCRHLDVSDAIHPQPDDPADQCIGASQTSDGDQLRPVNGGRDASNDLLEPIQRSSRQLREKARSH
ncbi:hypothetical protein NP233_g9 [Leucocoprinus birnbaumii]|uniref:HTH CENPB-type domain-containing protein n=1 Tax=Leucocoprinus birnbaumii TaxID=56174 RepID=A0AAD5W603_9AGAR|nr:hypothetical protein NP233_g9 [Leucocoprinus birnbaumii]